MKTKWFWLVSCFLLVVFAGCSSSEQIKKAKKKVDIATAIENLEDDDKEVRRKAAKFLGKHKVKKAVDPLVDVLDDPKQEVREQAIDSLGHIGDRRALPALIERFDHINTPVFPTYLETMEELKAGEYMAEQWKNVRLSQQQREHYAKVMNDLKTLPLDQLVRLLDQGNFRSNRPLIELLLNRNDEAIHSTLISYLPREADEELQGIVVQVARKNRQMLPKLIDRLQFSQEPARSLLSIMAVLGELGSDGAEAIPALTELANSHSDPRIRQSATHTVSRIRGF